MMSIALLQRSAARLSDRDDACTSSHPARRARPAPRRGCRGPGAGAGGTTGEGVRDSGDGHGLLSLGADEPGTGLPALFSYWREFGTRYITALCALPGIGEGTAKAPVPLPAAEDLTRLPALHRR